MDTMEQMLSLLLDGAVETPDIPAHLQALAIHTYQEVGNWLAEHGECRCRVYPQGSFRLGTVVRPHTLTGDFDVDLVFLMFIRASSISRAIQMSTWPLVESVFAAR